MTSREEEPKENGFEIRKERQNYPYKVLREDKKTLQKEKEKIQNKGVR